MWLYNNERPHKALGYKPPTEYLNEKVGNSAIPTLMQDEENNWKFLISSATN
jgi:hypothetical protein